MIGRIRPGLPAHIRVDAFAGEDLTGTVQAVAPLPDPNRFFNSDIKVYNTHVTIDKGLPGLRPGMTAQVEIPVTELDNVLSVPIQSVLHYGGKDHVALKKPEGGFDWREVTPGVSDGKRIEIKRGLQSGDLVID